MGPEAEFEDYDRAKKWNLIYHKIRLEAYENHDFSYNDAKKPEYRSRNRYRDVSPYDHSRVILKRDDIDYINASLVKSPAANRSYILTQGPLPHTSGHFWLMVWEQNTRAVLMLNRVIEKQQIKCHQYFPLGAHSDGEDEMVFEDVDLKVTLVAEEDASYYIIRTLEIEDLRSGEKKEILQFHYITWPDFGVPESPAAFLDFLFAVRFSGALDPDVGPPVIHCSAGIGRSGTFCIVDTCLVLIERNQDVNFVNVYEILMDMRQYRMGLIQTADQLRFSYLAIIEGSKRVLHTSQDSGIGDQDAISQDSEADRALRGLTDSEADQPDRELTNNYNNEPPPLPPKQSARPARQEDLIDLAPLTTQLKEAQDLIAQQADMNSVEQTTLVDDHVDDLNDLEQDEATSESLRAEGVAVRRRKRDERLKKTSEQIARMKKKQMESENWSATKKDMNPYLIGLSVAVLIGGYLLYKYCISS